MKNGAVIIEDNGRRVETLQDPSSGIGLVIGTLKGDVRLSWYFQDNLIREFEVSQEFAAQLSAAFERASKHGI